MSDLYYLYTVQINVLLSIAISNRLCATVLVNLFTVTQDNEL